MIEPSGIRVYIRHVREEMLCVRGMREWARLHNFDFHEFVRSGITVEELEATGDDFARRLCERARRESELKS
jgi:hypothetical protein